MLPDIHEFVLRLKALFHKRRLDRDLDEELAFHQAMMREKMQREGMSGEQAQREIRRNFGDAFRWQERLRELWQFPRLENLVRDIVFAGRLLRRSPGFTVIALLTLMTGIGASTAVFSLINSLMLRPLPVPHAEELVALAYEQNDFPHPSYGLCIPFARALEKHPELFEGVAVFSDSPMQVRGKSGTIETLGSMVSGQFFSTMQVPALLGRYLTPEDDRPGGNTAGIAVVLSEEFWASWFHSDPNIIGSKLIVSNIPLTIVGVMPKGFRGGDPTHIAKLYTPLSAEPQLDAPYNMTAGGHHAWWLHVLARRKAGLSLEQENAGLRSLSNGILHEWIPDPEWIKDAEKGQFHFVATPGAGGYTYFRTIFKRPLSIVFSLCMAMFLLSCFNLASLLTAKTAARERELATRLAIGASRKRLIQQLLTESFLLSFAGTLLGVSGAPFLSHILRTLLLGHDPQVTLDASLDPRVMGFVVFTAVVASLVIGLVPALRAISGNINTQIKDGASSLATRLPHRLISQGLLGIEVALALILVTGAGLLATSVYRLYRSGLGFDPKGVVNFSLSMTKQPLEGDALLRWYQQFGNELLHQPTIKSLSFVRHTPLEGSSWTDSLSSASVPKLTNCYMNAIAPDYFTTMRIPMLNGRDFRWTDNKSNGNKLILNRKAANLFFPGQNPIGQFLSDNWNKVQWEVIAVVGDSHYSSLRQEVPPTAYMPLALVDDPKPSFNVVLRIQGSPVPVAQAFRTLLARTAPEVPLPIMTPMEAMVDDSIGSERMVAMLSVFFAGCALLVTAIGLYGTLAYSTAKRTTEIGIRMAMGAKRSQVVTLIFKENVWTILGGSFAGFLTALLASRLLTSFLYGTSTTDPWILMLSIATLAGVASVASLIPAVRAARVEPIAAIRCE